MRWADHAIVFVVAALAIAAVAPAGAAEPPAYGQVETFQPGKKYNCLPTPDRTGWNCTETGKADISRDEPKAEPPTAEPAPAATPVAAAAAASPVPSAPTPASELPNYLTNASASGNPSTPASPAAAAPISTNPQRKHVDNAAPPPSPAPAAKPAVTAAPEKSQPVPARTAPVAESPAEKIPLPSSAPEPRAADRGSVADFLALPGNHYVVELAQGEREAEIAAARSNLHLPHGETYTLHLRQNGVDQWLLVWGSFDDVEAARSARADLPATLNAGWPRRIAPLQDEVRRTQE
jgi:septal ring-binding cell division protein DamX